MDPSPAAPRAVALIGPYGGGKTTLLESLLCTSQTLRRRGRVEDGTSFGDFAPESRARRMSTEITVARARYLEEEWFFLDCPGSMEFLQATRDALKVVDMAVVVCDPDPQRTVMLVPLLRFLAEQAIPYAFFINKIDRDGTGISVRACLESFQQASSRPLILRELPIRENGQIAGYVDLVSERAYRYRAGEASDLIRLPEELLDDESRARRALMENLADFNDALLEALIEESVPPKEHLYNDLARDLRDGIVAPVFFGAAEQDRGVRRLWKALRHECPSPERTAKRLGLDGAGTQATLFRTLHGGHAGSLSFVRLWSGRLEDGMTVFFSSGGKGKISGLYLPNGGDAERIRDAGPGAVAALGRLEKAATGALIGSTSKDAPPWPAPLPPLFGQSLRPLRQGDDVKLLGVLAKAVEEDASLSVIQSVETGELQFWGQGSVHLQATLERLRRLFHIEIEGAPPRIPYQETLRDAVRVQGRYKRQSGGHGQFGDVWLSIEPLPRGSGFRFNDKIVGGVVPKSYIPAVEAGIREWARRGPLGFPVVDFTVTLDDGSCHSVDSSDLAFRTAAALAMRKGAETYSPILLEPVLFVEAAIPAEATSKTQRLFSGRRGQILGLKPKEDWPGWDVVQACLPQAEMHDLIAEIRSGSMGVGTFVWRFDHVQEFTGRNAEQVVNARRQEASAS